MNKSQFQANMFNVNNRYLKQKKNANVLYDLNSTLWKIQDFKRETNVLFLKNPICHHVTETEKLQKFIREFLFFVSPSTTK